MHDKEEYFWEINKNRKVKEISRRRRKNDNQLTCSAQQLSSLSNGRASQQNANPTIDC